MRKQTRKNRNWMWVVLMTIAVSFALYSYFTPFAMDDFLFMSVYMEHAGNASTFSFKALIDYAAEIRLNDNGRLSNILCAPVTLFVAHWLFAAITGFCFALMYWLMAGIARIRHSDRAMVILFVWALSIVLLPFRNTIIVCDYLLNYLYPSVFILAFVMILQKLERKRLGAGAMTGALFVALCAGWLHEGFSVPLGCGLFVYAACKRFRLSGQWWVLVGVFWILCLWTVTSPGIMARAGREINGLDFGKKLFMLVTVLPAFVALVAVWFVSLFNRRLKTITTQVESRQEGLIMSVAAAVGAIMNLLLDAAPRAGWPAELYSMTVLLMYQPFVSCRLSRWVRRISFATVYILLVGFFINLIVWQKRFYDQDKSIMEQFDKSDTGTIYHDLIDPLNFSARVGTFFMSSRYFWVETTNYNFLSDKLSITKYEGQKRWQGAILPTVFRDYRKGKERYIPGNAGVRDYRGILFSESLFDENKPYDFSCEAQFDFITENGTVYEDQRCLITKFIGPDKKAYTYIYPLTPVSGKVVKADLKEIKRFRNY